jgi:flagellar protein FliO/FliZ
MNAGWSRLKPLLQGAATDRRRAGPFRSISRRRALPSAGAALLWALPLPLLAQAPAVGSAVPTAGNPWGLLLGLLFLLALVVGAWWLVRRMGGMNVAGSRQMRVLASLPVGARERVVIVEIAGEQWALGVAPGRVSLLHRFAEPVWPTQAQGEDFTQRMRQLLQQGMQR